ncbi:MAG: undecaprenyl/decaprenyl-phosphate alpha-N-acetylglucosaminyl 1-phosphate transferase, partial [Chloroflexota bacterium]|nr:undecaprenyl/decaprenyl-phosphate alpha-N-acetylglucosaminyl 1-phosphate transferase [Chloroflexota bacterium]
VLFAVLGVVDDLSGLPPQAKLGGQLLIAVAVTALGLSLDRLGAPWGIVATGWLAGPLTVVSIVAAVNAINLIDGMDGLAAGVTVAAAAVLLVAAAAHGIALPLVALPGLIGALLGFLVYNFNPASIIMGDGGSMFIGFMLAAASITVVSDERAPVSLLVPVLALAVPIGDTLLAIARRVRGGRSVLHADKEHIHHRLLARGLSQRSAALVLYGASALAGIAGIVVVLVSPG